MATIASGVLPFSMSPPSAASSPIQNRFPTPATVWGFMTTPESEIVVDGLSSPHTLAGALSFEGPYLEPTTGQIWPR